MTKVAKNIYRQTIDKNKENLDKKNLPQILKQTKKR